MSWQTSPARLPAGLTSWSLDVLVNCAGYFPVLPFEKMSAANWRRVIDINLTGTFLMTHAMLPLMKTTGWGRIINFSSGSVFSGVPGQTHYVAPRPASLASHTHWLVRWASTASWRNVEKYATVPVTAASG